MASYKNAVEWIAKNDNDGDGDLVLQISKYVTTCLVADLWGKPTIRVAADILQIREELQTRN